MTVEVEICICDVSLLRTKDFTRAHLLYNNLKVLAPRCPRHGRHTDEIEVLCNMHLGILNQTIFNLSVVVFQVLFLFHTSTLTRPVSLCDHYNQ